MKAHLLTVAALAVLVSGPTFAEDAYGFPPGNQPSSLTRAQVRAELQDAEAKGLLTQTDTIYPSDSIRTLTAGNGTVVQSNSAPQVGGATAQPRGQNRVIPDPSTYAKP
ncbi:MULTISPECIES: DUF4148 domain-containing protein [Pandoraea]|uniref:DUF4148 domain-containing protein n=2 Tax=Pandoraea TaxID=93217 RepID=A0A5E5PBS7_9BURK|nr:MULTISPECIES: DUF4148 domain-containing protein [Pandoraea]MBN9094653.1 DUF4148 domain-containing protein [Pandoraea pnomenusa]OXS88464.1 hypothetical protein B7H01_22190 [Pandoraea apista]RRJ28836.1 DUF4148 domain-containing protein [Pandoraea apista]RRJ73764.1 DUF4148 domain-containing protein [Pandoraea apista]RSD07634.1 DUF4148 domain-containing protein [Pandoraea apista]